MQLMRDKLKASRIELKNIGAGFGACALESDRGLPFAQRALKTARRLLAESIKFVPTKGRKEGRTTPILRLSNDKLIWAILARRRQQRANVDPLEHGAFLLIAQKAASTRRKIAASANKMFEDAFKIAKSHKVKLPNHPMSCSKFRMRRSKRSKRAGPRDAAISSTTTYKSCSRQIDRVSAWRAFVLAGDNNTAMVSLIAVILPSAQTVIGCPPSV